MHLWIPSVGVLEAVSLDDVQLIFCLLIKRQLLLLFVLART